MERTLTVEDLRAFEESIAEAFNQGQIRAPVHLADGNEEALIAIFQDVQPADWVFCSWRSHYQCLLKGVPTEDIKREILAGRSISLCFPEYRVYSSAIVGGSIPIAVGTALGILRSGVEERVWCFVGDMTAEIGMANTAFKFAANMGLPLTFVVEDNGVSVMTPTREVWGQSEIGHATDVPGTVIRYSYKSKYPHAGAGIRVEF